MTEADFKNRVIEMAAEKPKGSDKKASELIALSEFEALLKGEADAS
jgi:hypothetical protein